MDDCLTTALGSTKFKNSFQDIYPFFDSFAGKKRDLTSSREKLTPLRCLDKIFSHSLNDRASSLSLSALKK